MSLDALIMLTGTLVAVVPLLGFPPQWNEIFFLILGVFIFGLGIVVRRRGTGRALPRRESVQHEQQPASSEVVEDGEVA